jgi:hypothetical protein
MRVQKTGSKSTVQLMKTGWLWGQRKHAQVPGGIEKKENEYGAPMLCNVASCTRGPMTMPVKVLAVLLLLLEDFDLLATLR